MSGSHVEDVGDVGLNVRIMIFANDVTITLLMDRPGAAGLREKLGTVLDQLPSAGSVTAPAPQA